MNEIFKKIDYARRKLSGTFTIDDEEMLNKIGKALEKQVPKKLKYRNFYQGYKCDCGADVTFKMQKYCVDCGQRLDWSVEE